MGDEEAIRIIEYLKKWHELRTTEDVAKVTALMRELHAGVDCVNSKLNKNEEVCFYFRVFCVFYFISLGLVGSTSGNDYT